MQNKQCIYRIIFTQEDKVYEICVRYISEENLMGFIEVEELVFSESGSVVVDPTEEKLKKEFQGVKRSYIPMHMILRIDEMEKEGMVKLKAAASSDNVRQFPRVSQQPVKDKE